jgi:AcrR family transcriptional regulator
MADLAIEADGRKLRRESNREAVIDALLALFVEGNYEPSAAEIASRAGLSPRSLFRYFNDMDNLHRAAAQRQIEVTAPLVEVMVDQAAPTAVKIEALLDTRARLYELVGKSARAMRAPAQRNHLLAAELTRRRAILSDQIAEIFAPELALAGDSMLIAIDTLCSFDSYELLRNYHGLSRAEAISTLTVAVTALLGSTT